MATELPMCVMLMVLIARKGIDILGYQRHLHHDDNESHGCFFVKNTCWRQIYMLEDPLI